MLVANSPAEFLDGVKHRNPYQEEFHQAVSEVVDSIWEWYLQQSDYHDAQILERITEPDRVISFRVCWETDDGQIRANRGWRVQFNHCLGPYKGGIRFHHSVNESVLKFLAFEQIFKNSLTGLPLGGGKGGANFNPDGKSDREIMRFCQSFMTELSQHIGKHTDIPAGDIGVGQREISYLFGQYLKIKNEWAGVLTGKGSPFGGSNLRKEATGYGCVMFCEKMLKFRDHGIEGREVAISGSGNVALYAAEKCLMEGAKVVTLSDSKGFVHIPKGLSQEQLDRMIFLKETKRKRISDLAAEFGEVHFYADKKPWDVKCDIAMPCATQNEINGTDMKNLLGRGIVALCEGANMPLTSEATEMILESEILYAPGKASNAGGVSVSGLEISQNSLGMFWTKEKVYRELDKIINTIHDKCVEYACIGGKVNYMKGANIAGFKRVADAMLAYGVH